MARNISTVDEEIKNGLNLSTLAKLGGYMKKYRAKIFITIILMLINSFLAILAPYFISKAIDVYVPAKDITSIVWICVILLLSYIGIFYTSKTRGKIINDVGYGFVRDIREDLFNHLQHLPFSYFDSRPHGKILVRIVNYTGAISNLISNGIVDIITNIFTIVVIIIFMFSMNVKFTLICLSGVPVFILITTFLRSSHRKSWQTLSAKQSNLNAYLHESISGVKVTQSFTRENEDFKKFAQICKDNKTYWMKAKFIEMGIPVSVNIISVLVTIFLFYFGAIGLYNGTVQLGVLLAFSSYVNSFWTPISALASYYNEIMTCSAYIERIFELLDEPLVIEDLKDATPLPAIKGNVKFEDVTFRYEEDGPNILENVSFEAKDGVSIALVGPTGAGKSTIVNLISRFYDIQGGKITIDGFDIKHATLKSLRTQMGIMLQDSFLFTGTIMENIKYSKLDATDEEVYEVAKIVCAHDMIMSLPDKYDTLVTERGDSLSTGQRQLICFARTLLANPAILILDEATSNIDTQTELALQEGLNNLIKGRTSFIIAHRLSTIKSCDEIMYISNKNISERGNHETLMEKKGKYYELYNAQYKFLGEI